MADPIIPVVIGVKVPTANIGEFVIVRNLTRGGKLTKALRGTDRSVVLNPAPSLRWQEGDTIQAEIRGRLAGVAQKTIESGKVQFTGSQLGATVDTSTPGVSL